MTQQNRTAIAHCLLVLNFIIWSGWPGSTFAQDPIEHAAAGTVSGIVFEDTNGNRQLDPGEKGLKGVAVSNQLEVVVTDKRGRYTLPVSEETVIYVTKPSGYQVPLDENNLPRFYYIHQPEGSPELEYPGVKATGPLPQSVDFPLNRVQKSSTAQVLVLGDTQPYTHAELDYLRDDIAAELAGSAADFAIILGDVVGNDLSLYDRYKQIMAQIGIPIYNVPGNHDENYDSPDDRYALETFKRHFGPTYYSFDAGQTHFILLDDVEYLGRDPEGVRRYRGRIGEQQLAWLANDLRLVPDDRLVVLTMHIPLAWDADAGDALRVTDADALYDILEMRPHILALAGHMHTNDHRYLAQNDGWEGEKPLHQIVCGAACGAWWSGPRDARGVPVSYQTDGAPNGYYVFEFSGNTYRARFKAAGQDPEQQLHIILPAGILTTEALDTVQIMVNVYDGGPRSKVEYRLDDQPFRIMERTIGADPFFAQLVAQYPELFRGWIESTPSTHLWTISMPPSLSTGVHTITARSTDRYGQTWEEHRVFEIQESAAAQ